MGDFMKIILALLIVSASGFACTYDPNVVKHKLSIHAINYLQEKKQMYVMDLKNVSAIDYVGTCSPQRNCGFQCPDIHSAKIESSYLVDGKEYRFAIKVELKKDQVMINEIKKRP
jgi:hypothetical protein